MTNLGQRFMAWLITSPLHGLLGDGLALITVRGRKSGRDIATPINITPEGEGWFATSLRTRTWWRNLRGGAGVALQQGARRWEVRGAVIEDPAEVARALADYFARHPANARFFNVRLEAGRPHPADLQRLGEERVVVQLSPG